MSTNVIGAGLATFRYQRMCLRVLEGPDRGLVGDDAEGELACGTAADNQLPLTDPTVSRYHFTLSATSRGMYLRDAGSTNGIVVGGCRVEAAYLEPGAVLQVGKSTLRFERGDREAAQPLSASDTFGRALGRSVVMRRLFEALPRIASSDAIVLLEGETGTGKTLIAEAIHQASTRRTGPFSVIDCGAIPPSLIETELFGHERGAFTGAQQQRIGAIEAGAGGTVFFDEIGELPLELQPRLLRAIEDHTIKRVGGQQPIHVDIRIIAATHKDLRAAVNRGDFRADLYYRLHVVSLRLPPLRERRLDIPLLVEQFYAQFAGCGGAPEALVAAFTRQDWPGNIRELRGAVERAVLLDDPAFGTAAADPEASDGRGPGDVFDGFDAALSFRASKARATMRWERAYLGALLAHHEGNLSRAARAARMDRTHLRELGRRHALVPAALPDDDSDDPPPAGD